MLQYKFKGVRVIEIGRVGARFNGGRFMGEMIGESKCVANFDWVSNTRYGGKTGVWLEISCVVLPLRD